MKQYFTGFFTAICLTASVFLFMGQQNSDEMEAKSIVFKGVNGTTFIEGGRIFVYNLDGKQTAFICTNDRMDGEIKLQNKLGYKIISMCAHRGDGFSGNGSLTINNEHGEYGWSVIGEVSPEHYK